MGLYDHPRKQKAPFHLPQGTSLDLSWQSGGQVPALFRRRKNSLVVTHAGWGLREGTQKSLEPMALWRRGRVWGIAFCHTTGIYPIGLWGPCPSWSLFSVWLWMVLTSHLGSHEIHWSPLCKASGPQAWKWECDCGCLTGTFLFVPEWEHRSIEFTEMPNKQGSSILYVGQLFPLGSFSCFSS